MRDVYRVSGKKNWGKKLSMQSNCHFLVGKGEERSSGGSPEKKGNKDPKG